MLTPLAATLFWATLVGAPAGSKSKLPVEMIKEMTSVIVAVDKALGLESWLNRAKPCVDRGDPDGKIRDVTPEETRTCAAGVLGSDFPGLGKSYVLAILMAPFGPSTVIALALDEHQGWGAYSCDPGRKCLPVRLDPSTKWGKRVLDRQTRACRDDRTVWFPEGQKLCP